MSHAVVLVTFPTEPDDNMIDEVMLPYHEYESTGIEKYIEEVDITDDVMREFEEYKETHNNPTLEKYIDDEYGGEQYCIIRDNKVYKITNPNAKWDWYSIGGRYSYFINPLMFKDIEKYNKSNVIFQKKDIVYGVTDKKRKSVRKCFEEVNKFVNELEKYGIDLKTADTDELRRHYNYVKSNNVFSEEVDEILDSFLGFISIVKGTITEDEYILSYSDYTPFALLHEGKWYEMGRLGWFAHVFDENNNWDKDLIEIWNTIPDDYWIVVIDFHI